MDRREGTSARGPEPTPPRKDARGVFRETVAGRRRMLRQTGRDHRLPRGRLASVPVLLVTASMLAVLPIRPAVAETALTCTQNTFETIDPGLTSEVRVQHHNGSGTWVCSGSIVGTPVISSAGPMEFRIRTEGNCLTERGVGTAKARIPLSRYDFALVHLKYTYTREGNAIAITGTEGTAEVNGERDDLAWHGVMNATPTKGDCITEPVSAARVNGQIVGVGSE